MSAVSPSLASGIEKPSVLFIHHSVGESLIKDGAVREILTEAGFNFWDHDYNDPKIGLRNEKGLPSGCYCIPDDNTDPDGLAALFQLDPKADNALNKILTNHDVIIFKSCFPTSQVLEDNPIIDSRDPKRKSLSNYKRHYLRVREAVDSHPDKIFILVTQPPLHPNATNQYEARRAKQLVEWFKSDEFIGDRKNLFVFDYFSLLADPRTNTLKREYQIDQQSSESHPNILAQMQIGPRFADFIINTVRFKAQRDLPEISFDLPGWADQLVRVTTRTVSLSGTVTSRNKIKNIFWSDLKGGRGELPQDTSWQIPKLMLNPGVTKIVVTAIDAGGVRSSSAIGLQYYSGKAKEAVLFDGTSKPDTLYKVSYFKGAASGSRGHLVIEGNGSFQRVVMGGFNLDISDYDPATASLEIKYDQGTDDAKGVLYVPGIGSIALDVDSKPGAQTIVIPLKQFIYAQNILNSLVFKGSWRTGTQVRIESIKIIDRAQKSHLL
jgi:hypothetical protein